MKSGKLKDDKISFAEGLRLMNEKGALIIKTRLTKRRARLLIDFISEFKHHWYSTHLESDSDDDMQHACQWIVNNINKKWSQHELYAINDED